MTPSRLLMSIAAALSALTAAVAQPSLTIYNQNFAVVREHIPLDLKNGVNAVTFAGATLHLEPDSVVLRDPSGKTDLSILEQSYRADTLSQGLLLSLYEGKEIDFIVREPLTGKESKVRGKIIRSGYTPNYAAGQRYGQQFMMAQQQAGNWQGGGSPIIEVDGQLRFSLPGEPMFPAVTDDAILKPQLSWQLAASKRAKIDAELSYITGGLSWEAAYNLIAPEKGDTLDIVGWVTIDNQSGKTFDNAVLKLMAGDVSKLQPQTQSYARAGAVFGMMKEDKAGYAVTEKAFDEFHLYSLPRPTTLRNRETKQVEFLRANGVKAPTIYIYNGAAIDPNRYNGWNDDNIRNDRDYGTKSNAKVWVMREFKNTKANGLGLPLPKGRTRFYRQDDADNRLEFTGENTIDHTPEGETVRIYTGDAFDIVGERKRTDYKLMNQDRRMEEAFAITLRNRKKEPVEVRVTERLYRWINWTVMTSSDPYVKTDARNVEFRITLKPDEEKVITYRVGYDWN